jgi:glycosyltransferase involved in cell wall biosynthesis
LKAKVRYPILSIVHHLRGSEHHQHLAVPIYRTLEKHYLRTVDGFVFNSQTTRKVVEGILGTTVKGIVATPGGDRLGSGLNEAEIRARFEESSALRLLFVGNIIARKGLDTLIEALARIKGVDWTLRIAGRDEVDPAYTMMVKRMVRDFDLAGQVTFLGRVEEEDLVAELRGAHLLVVPSQYEGFGIVYLEAMAFGLPPVASSAGAASEIIQSGKNGLIVQPGNPLNMAERLADLFHDRQKLLAMSLAARERFEQFPGWDTSMASVRQFLLSWVKES